MNDAHANYLGTLCAFITGFSVASLAMLGVLTELGSFMCR